MTSFKFSRTARKHRIGRAHVQAALRNGGTPNRVWQAEHEGTLHTYMEWIAPDDRDVELEIVGRLALEDPDLVIILHVMPTQFRTEKGDRS